MEKLPTQRTTRRIPTSRRLFVLFVRNSALVGAGSALLEACAIATERQQFSIIMADPHQLNPASLTVPKGATIVWKNRSTERHTATCDPARVPQNVEVMLPQGAAPWDSGELLTGQTWMHTFETPGSYVYACRYSGAEGMIGSIKVTE